MAVIQPSSNVSDLELGFYGAQVTEIKEVTGEFGPQLEFHFTLLNDEGKQLAREDGSALERRAWCSAKWHEKAKLFGWSRTLLKAKCPPATEPFDWEVLLNRKCDIQLVPSKKDPAMMIIGDIYPYRSMSAADEDEAPPARVPVGAGVKGDF